MKNKTNSVFDEKTFDIQKEETNARIIPWAILASIIITTIAVLVVNIK